MADMILPIVGLFDQNMKPADAKSAYLVEYMTATGYELKVIDRLPAEEQKAVRNFGS